ncbi:hypothetical protein Q6272_30640, partial [Klebsiella pneumoniae]|uniref:hypothetical protein n=1 Tax=Klebsiella pneumoniae TaxID=573 RepID=UPI002731CEA4
MRQQVNTQIGDICDYHFVWTTSVIVNCMYAYEWWKRNYSQTRKEILFQMKSRITVFYILRALKENGGHDLYDQ